MLQEGPHWCTHAKIPDARLVELELQVGAIIRVWLPLATLGKLSPGQPSCQRLYPCCRIFPSPRPERYKACSKRVQHKVIHYLPPLLVRLPKLGFAFSPLLTACKDSRSRSRKKSRVCWDASSKANVVFLHAEVSRH